MKIDMGLGGLEFGSGVTRFPGLVSMRPNKEVNHDLWVVYQ